MAPSRLLRLKRTRSTPLLTPTPKHAALRSSRLGKQLSSIGTSQLLSALVPTPCPPHRSDSAGASFLPELWAAVKECAAAGWLVASIPQVRAPCAYGLCVCVFVCVRACVCARVRVCACVYSRAHARLHARAPMFMHVCLCPRACVL